METTFESQLLSILGLVALVLMLVVTGGIVYLTAADWRDRRRRKRDQDSTATRSKKRSKK
jgi:hypothetical protein